MEIEEDLPTREIFFPQGRLFYGWIVVTACFVTLFITYGIVYSFGVFFVAMFRDFAWTRAETAGVFSVNQLIYGGSAPLAGMLLDRWGPRLLMPLGALVMAVGLLASSQIDSLWQFYLFYGCIFAAGVIITGSMTNAVVVQHWFARRRGTASAIALSGVGFGTLVFAPVTQYLVSSFSWRFAFQMLAVTVILGIVPLTLLLHRRSPQSVGLTPDGLHAAGEAAAKVEAERSVVDRTWAARRWDVRAALRTRRFWLIFIGMTLGGLSSQTMLVHQIAFLGDSKIDPMAAALALGLVGLVSAVCRPVWGIVSDTVGREHGFVIAALLTCTGIVTLMASSWIGATWLVWVYVLLFSVGYSGSMFAAIAADVFQSPSFGAIYGVLYIATGIGGAFGPWFAGYTHDLTSNYYLAFSVAAAAYVLAALVVWLASPRKIRMVAGKLRPAP